ncbi:hypothetical protein GGX14DRAFT_558219 [Mycena pura]|uniref:Uncharacterized protein n=1 Tax=Mycena pura TaxID=153505 RepID=A0AAD6YKC0_9AGAR|nr:hypothetical protein GGX14DRAFT_558219 [Mycena pura]
MSFLSEPDNYFLVQPVCTGARAVYAAEPDCTLPGLCCAHVPTANAAVALNSPVWPRHAYEIAMDKYAMRQTSPSIALLVVSQSGNSGSIRPATDLNVMHLDRARFKNDILPTIALSLLPCLSVPITLTNTRRTFFIAPPTYAFRPMTVVT